MKYKFTCLGGPMEGHNLWLRTDSTLAFSLNGMYGYYRGEGSNTLHWHEVQK